MEKEFETSIIVHDDESVSPTHADRAAAITTTFTKIYMPVCTTTTTTTTTDQRLKPIRGDCFRIVFMLFGQCWSSVPSVYIELTRLS